MDKTDRSVVRNQPYQRKGIGIRERHNERKNENYSNPDIELNRSHMNVHFKHCESTYERTLDKMLEQGTVSTRGLKSDAKIFEEMVFDVNTAYFDRHGGYEYAKQFFEEAYRFAQKEVGSDYILSAVMHADERNKALSEQHGRDIYHYHLHVVYIPVVDKVVKWSKRCRDKSLVGTTKEVIHQISHSKKWAFPTKKDEFGRDVLNKDGKPIKIPSYSPLQDRFFNHMQHAGYKDFERGEKGSTAENLTTLNYKIQQDLKRLDELTAQITEQKSNLEQTKQEIAEIKPIKAGFDEVSAIGKKKLLSSKIEMLSEEYDKLQNLAKEGLSARLAAEQQNQRIGELRRRLMSLNREYDRFYESTREYREAVKLAPERIRELFDDIFRQDKATKEHKQNQWKVRIGGRNDR